LLSDPIGVVGAISNRTQKEWFHPSANRQFGFTGVKMNQYIERIVRKILLSEQA
jgi:hypothetical protein